MKQKLKSLNTYQKFILYAMLFLSIGFALIYYLTVSKVGFEYKDKIFIRTQENETIIYSGILRGKDARFTVFENKRVLFSYGDKTYGPYKAIEDSSAIPDDFNPSHYIGIELYHENQLIFRGCISKLNTGNSFILYNEDGTWNSIRDSHIEDDEIEWNGSADINDSLEPSIATILMLMFDPKLTHKGDWLMWFGAVFLCVVNTIEIIYADELFRWRMSFRIKNSEITEASELEIASRYLTMTIWMILAVVVFIVGLQ